MRMIHGPEDKKESPAPADAFAVGFDTPPYIHTTERNDDDERV